jgi:hypothetical protein
MGRLLKSSMPALRPRKLLLKQRPPPCSVFTCALGGGRASSCCWNGRLMQRSRLRSGHLGGLLSSSSFTGCSGVGGGGEDRISRGGLDAASGSAKETDLAQTDWSVLETRRLQSSSFH